MDFFSFCPVIYILCVVDIDNRCRSSDKGADGKEAYPSEPAIFAAAGTQYQEVHPDTNHPR